jgi:hypothetical protein
MIYKSVFRIPRRREGRESTISQSPRQKYELHCALARTPANFGNERREAPLFKTIGLGNVLGKSSRGRSVPAAEY